MTTTSLKQKPLSGLEQIAAEQMRGPVISGWTPERAQYHDYRELTLAAAWYALPEDYRRFFDGNDCNFWPFDWEWWKPGANTREGRIQELVKAGALIAAEIDRLQEQDS